MTLSKLTSRRGAAYLRVSDDSKQDHESQREVVQSWLDIHGLSVVVWYEDHGSRHEAYRRPEFQRLLRDVEAGCLDWVVVDIKDRFGTANIWEFGKFICHLREHGCELWSVAQGCLSSDDAVTSILNTVDSVRSQDEQVNKAIRSVRGAVSGAKQGEWQGGYPPYGFDIVCHSPDGQEKWRVYYIGQHKRHKIYRDGKPPERFDGKGNFPGRDPGDILRLAPSCDKERVETVKRIFFWYATEAISLRGLCHRLNGLGISPVIGEAWYTSRLGPMLRNPAYLVGQEVWNKNGHGDFREWRDGTYQEVERIRGKAKAGRKRHQKQYVYPQGEFEGLIDRDTWDQVQAKLKAMPKADKAPKNSALWLAGLLYCGQCGKRMVGWHQKTDKTCSHSYTCPTYRQFGASNPSGCRLHRTNHKIIEALVRRYLEEAGQGLEAVLAATVDGAGEEIIQGLMEQQEETRWEYMRHLGRLWREVQTTGARPPKGQPWTAPTLCAAYQTQAAERRAETARRLAEKEAELAQTLTAFVRLTNAVAIEAANRQIEEIGNEIGRLRQDLHPLDERVQALRADLERLGAAIAASQQMLAGDGNRQKAQAVGRVIARIVCRFRHGRAGSQARSILTEVVIEPLVGGPRTYGTDGAGERG